MVFTIADRTPWWRRHREQSIVLPLPPACARLMTLAQAANIPVGTLTIVACSPEPGQLGSYDPASGDLCCYADPRLGEASLCSVLPTLFILIAHLKLHFPLPQTIEEEWEQFSQSIEEAVALARQWGQPRLFPLDERQQLLRWGIRLALCHLSAGELAGHSAPAIARQAYTALYAHRSRFPSLDEDTFFRALAGTSEEERFNDALVDFDRSRLRANWISTRTRSSPEKVFFGELALPPFPGSARVLRSALKCVADQAPARRNSAQDTSLVFRHVNEHSDLIALLHLVTTWLIDTAPHAALRLCCRVYGDAASMVEGTARLYRLVLAYEEHPEGEALPPRNLWVLFAAGRRTLDHRAREGAWQRFLESWLRWSDVRCEPLATGLHLLWCQVEHGLSSPGAREAKGRGADPLTSPRSRCGRSNN